MEQFAILIPNYNGANFITETVFNYASGFPDADIVVVDDVSTDESVEKLSATTAKVLLRKKNGGFAAAVNTGLIYLSKQNYKYVLISNSDVVVDDLKCAEIESTLPKLSTSSNLAVLGFLEESISNITVNEGSNISGFLFALRLDTLKTVGHMDESFFMYGEEQDFFRRVIRAGYNIHQTEVIVKHRAEGSSTSRYKNSWLAIRNSLYLETKNNSFGAFIKKVGILFLLINRLYHPKAGQDQSLKRVLRPGIFLGNIFLLSAILWNIFKILMRLHSEKSSK